MSDRQAIEKRIRAYAGAWGARDRAQWVATFAESATQQDPVGSRVRRGRTEIGAFWDEAMAAYASIEITPADIFVIGHDAAMIWTIRAATPRGDIAFNGVDVFTFDDDTLIASVRAYWEGG